MGTLQESSKKRGRKRYYEMSDGELIRTAEKRLEKRSTLGKKLAREILRRETDCRVNGKCNSDFFHPQITEFDPDIKWIIKKSKEADPFKKVKHRQSTIEKRKKALERIRKWRKEHE